MYKNTLNRIKLSRVVSVVLVLGMFLLPQAITTAGEDIPHGGTLTTVLISEPRVISPDSLSWNDGFVAGQMFNSLLIRDDDLNLIPNLATEMPVINQEEGSYTFKFRSGVKFHDGEPMTAEDVKFTFENIVTYNVFGGMFFRDTTVEILDDTTVKIMPKTFVPPVQMIMFGGLMTSIVPEHILGDNVEGFLDDPFRTTEPIGTGPFKLKEWVQGSHIILERFDDYWAAPAPYLDEIVIRIMPEPATVLAAFQAGEVDYIFRGMPYEAFDTLDEDPELNVYSWKRPFYKASININTKHGSLSNVKVRQAIAYAINREDIVASATNGLASVTDTFYVPDVAPPSPDRTIYTHDPNKAKQILNDAGFIAHADGSRGISIELLLRRGEPEEELAAELIQDDLSNVGITVNLKIVDFGTFLELTSNYQYDMSLLKRAIMIIGEYQHYHSNYIIPGVPFVNDLQYVNEDLDAAFDAWLAESDPAKQIEYLQEAENHLTNDVPLILLYDVSFVVVVRNTFQPVPGAVFGTLPDGRFVFWDSLENMYSTEGMVPEIACGTMLWIGSIFAVVITTAVIVRKRQKQMN